MKMVDLTLDLNHSSLSRALGFKQNSNKLVSKKKKNQHLQAMKRNVYPTEQQVGS